MRSEPVGVTLPPSEPCPPQRTDAGQRDGMVQAGASSSPRIPPRRIGSNHFSSQQFQALFHSLFKVLSIFPSQYLFAIGLSPIFSFRWSLPPTLACIPKQADSLERPCQDTLPSQRRGSNPLWHPVPRTDFYPGLSKFAPIDYNSEDFRLELFPVHSPLLGESWLVSFPPLSDMLKFSG